MAKHRTDASCIYIHIYSAQLTVSLLKVGALRAGGRKKNLNLAQQSQRFVLFHQTEIRTLFGIWAEK